jgi:hypothetical protein
VTKRFACGALSGNRPTIVAALPTLLSARSVCTERWRCVLNGAVEVYKSLASDPTLTAVPAIRACQRAYPSIESGV